MKNHERILLNLEVPLAQRKRTLTGPYRWRATPPMSGRGFYMESSRSSSDLECAAHGSGFRLRIQHANDFIEGRTSHISGYGSESILESYQPIVFRLPRGRGFLAGWTMGPGMCAEMDPHIYGDERSAAYAAHSIAEYAAETEQEYQEAYQKGQELRIQLSEATKSIREGTQRARAAADAIAKGASDAARILKEESEKLLRHAFNLRTDVWTEMKLAGNPDAMRAGFLSH